MAGRTRARPRRPSKGSPRGGSGRRWPVRLALASALGALAFWYAPPSFTGLNRPDTGVVLLRERGGGDAQPFPVGEGNEMWVRLGEVPPELLKSVLEAEDKTFFSHRGIELRKLAAWILNGRQRGLAWPQTITMRLAGILYPWSRGGGIRRPLQVAVSFKLDRSLSKRRILELFLNTAGWGRGVYGVGEAARLYYQTDPRLLSADQCEGLARRLRQAQASPTG